jgi:hypothetical protein
MVPQPRATAAGEELTVEDLKRVQCDHTRCSNEYGSKKSDYPAITGIRMSGCSWCVTTRSGHDHGVRHRSSGPCRLRVACRHGRHRTRVHCRTPVAGTRARIQPAGLRCRSAVHLRGCSIPCPTLSSDPDRGVRFHHILAYTIFLWVIHPHKYSYAHNYL